MFDSINYDSVKYESCRLFEAGGGRFDEDAVIFATMHQAEGYAGNGNEW